MQKNIDEIGQNNKFNIIDVLLLDHSYLKKCIKILKSDEEKKIKLKFAKTFIDAFKKHSAAEKRTVYAPLVKVKDLRKEILKGEVEHGIIDNKIKILAPQIMMARVLSEEMEIELKVIAEIVEKHLFEEEDEIIPKMRQDLDKIILNEMGYQFMKIRNFTEKDLRNYPSLQREVPDLKNIAHRVSMNFIEKVQKHLI